MRDAGAVVMQCEITPISALTAALMLAIMFALVAASYFFGMRRDLAAVVRTIVVTGLGTGTLVLGYFLFASYQSVVFADENEIRLDIPIYGLSVERDSLQADSASVVDLRVQNELTLSRRNNGLGMFGYSLGWFTLANGTKAVAALTDLRDVVYIKQSDGHSILFSCQNAAGFVDFLSASEFSAKD